MPKPFRVDGRNVWDRKALDRAFDELAGEPAERNDWDDAA